MNLILLLTKLNHFKSKGLLQVNTFNKFNVFERQNPSIDSKTWLKCTMSDNYMNDNNECVHLELIMQC